ncbi:MFS transporter [Ancylobacter sp. WKF20]|uniref:MFS transporter n=1 Tax=Ancylobacter sp. WKF20 TaxID=3039801 RepID=UPI002434684F|nr:MFS transporter [Ancylobacter sp. WKF20]WGD29283.1 MFS transporter [Ancylobacter sp. WKF20]
MDVAALRARAPLFLAVFIDIFSFGLMYPLIVALFAGGWVAQAYPEPTRDLLLSLAFALFPVGMFFGASLLGDLSDALGRRRTLMICMSGLAAGYGLMWAALETGHLWLFFLGRLGCGLMAGTAPIAQASVVDAAPEDQRSAAMAQVVLVSTLGMVAGPALGGILGHWSFRLPLMLALALCLLTLALLRGADFAADQARRPLRLDWKQPFRLLARIVARPAVIAPGTAFLLFQFGYLIYYTFILIEMQRSYGFSTFDLGLFSAAIGLGAALTSAKLFAPLRAALGSDRPVALLGLAGCGLLVAATALPLPAWAQVALAFTAAMGNIIAYITLMAAISSAVDESERGWALGVANAGVALSVFLAGLLTSLLSLLPPDTFLALAGLLILAGLLPALRARMA